MESKLESLGDRIRKRREALDMTQAELGGLVGVSYQQISTWENDRQRPPRKRIPLLAKVLGMSTDEFFEGETDTLPPGAYEAGEMVLLPVIAQVQAGSPRIAIEEYEERAPVAAEHIRGGEYFWMRVEGDSMIDAGVHPGALVLVRRQPYVEDGQIGIVEVEDEGVVIKRVYRTNGRVMLVSENPAHKPKFVEGDECRIIGLAVKIQADLI